MIVKTTRIWSQNEGIPENILITCEFGANLGFLAVYNLSLVMRVHIVNLLSKRALYKPAAFRLRNELAIKGPVIKIADAITLASPDPAATDSIGNICSTPHLMAGMPL